MTEAQKVPDVRKTVTVDVPADRAFAIFAERPVEWFPERHVFVEDRVSLTIEPFEGGRYYEVGADGTEIAWGTVVEWNPSKRIVLTWRVGPHWQPIFDDEKASFIEVDFEPAGAGRTTVALTHSGLHRHGEIAPQIHAALDGPSPGDTLARYEQVVARVSAAAQAVPVTLVNRFQLTGTAEEFEQVFAATSEFFAAQPGFVEHTLHRRLGDPASYVNIARWADNASLRAAVAQPEFQPHSAALRALAVSSPELYEARLQVTAADAG